MRGIFHFIVGFVSGFLGGLFEKPYKTDIAAMRFGILTDTYIPSPLDDIYENETEH